MTTKGRTGSPSKITLEESLKHSVLHQKPSYAKLQTQQPCASPKRFSQVKSKVAGNQKSRQQAAVRKSQVEYNKMMD